MEKQMWDLDSLTFEVLGFKNACIYYKRKDKTLYTQRVEISLMEFLKGKRIREVASNEMNMLRAKLERENDSIKRQIEADKRDVKRIVDAITRESKMKAGSNIKRNKTTVTNDPTYYDVNNPLNVYSPLHPINNIDTCEDKSSNHSISDDNSKSSYDYTPSSYSSKSYSSYSDDSSSSSSYSSSSSSSSSSDSSYSSSSWD